MDLQLFYLQFIDLENVIVAHFHVLGFFPLSHSMSRTLSVVYFISRCWLPCKYLNYFVIVMLVFALSV